MPGMLSYCIQSTARNYGIVPAEIFVNLLRFQFWEHFQHFLVTFERYACNIHVASLLHFQYFQIIFPRYFRKYTEVYLQDVVSTSEVWSWLKLGQGSMYAIFSERPYKKNSWDAHRDNLDIIFGLLNLIYWVFYYLFLYPYVSLWNIKVLGKNWNFSMVYHLGKYSHVYGWYNWYMVDVWYIWAS